MARFVFFVYLSLFLASFTHAAPPSNTCSKTKLCEKVNQKGGQVDPASRLGRLITQSGMSIDEFKVQSCGLAGPTSEEPKPTPQAKAQDSGEESKEEQPDPQPAPEPEPEPEPSQSTSPPPNENSGNTGGSGSSGGGDQQQYLDIHNSLRASHGASPLKWNNDLAQKAQNWANGCKFEHSGVGENLAAGTGNYGIADALNSWAAEEKEYNPATESGAGHYTQMVWKATTDVGCAVAPSCSGIFDAPARYYVCEYSPPGNVHPNYAANVQ